MTSFPGSPEERLSAANPVTSSAYVHSDLNGALARITAQPRVAKVRFADGFRLKMGSAAAAAALVTVGGIATLTAVAPSLSVLALGQTHKLGATAAVPSTAIGGDMRIWGSNHFIAGPDLTSGSSSAPAYIVAPPTDLTAASEQIASALSITGTPSETPTANGSWTIGADTNQVSFYVSQGMLNWNYVANSPVAVPGATGSAGSSGTSSSGTPETTVPDPSTTTTTLDQSAYPTLGNDQALADAQSDLNALGVADQLGTPIYSVYPDDTNQVNQTTVQLPWIVNGLDTGNSFWFTFDPSGTLLYANGQIASITAGPIYPVLSEVDAVAALQKQQDQFRPMLGLPVTAPSTAPSATGDTTTTTTTDGAVSSSTDTVPTPVSTDTVPTTDPTPPVRDVTLVSATLGYQIYTLSDGSAALLAEYTFTADDGSTWTVLAVDPQYVSLQSSPMVF